MAIASTEFKEAGVILKVKATVTDEQKVLVVIESEQSINTGKEGVVSGKGVPIIDKREAQTNLLMDDGQVAVMGRLRRQETRHIKYQMPLLGDLPLIGAAFRFEGEDTVTSELVVFITPKIIEKPVLTEMDKRQLEITDFNGPLPLSTRAERPKAKN